jgi:hypothetical protein
MEQWHLAVNGLRGPLSFQQGWDVYRLDTWFRSLFPQAYRYLDTHFPKPPGELQWRLLIKTHNRLSLSPVVLPDGTDMSRYLGTTGKRTADRKIHIGEFPSCRFMFLHAINLLPTLTL